MGLARAKANPGAWLLGVVGRLMLGLEQRVCGGFQDCRSSCHHSWCWFHTGAAIEAGAQYGPTSNANEHQLVLLYGTMKYVHASVIQDHCYFSPQHCECHGNP